MGGPNAIITVYLSNEASQTTQKYETWTEAFDQALQDIAANPYPDGWKGAEVRDPDFPAEYTACIVVDYPPFTYTYRFDTPDEITVLTIRLCFPHNITM